MRITRWGGGVALGLAAGALALAAPAAAQDITPASPWAAIDTGAGGVQTASVHTATADATTAEVTWAAGEPASALGTSIENSNVGVAVVAGAVVSVDYELIGADPASGSVRLFIYDHADGDTFNVLPTQHVAAPDDGSTSGTLQIVVSFTGDIGTVGLVYDTSNGGVPGTVVFTNLTIDGQVVLFQALPEPSSTPTVGPAPTDPAPGAGGEKPGLPVTGSPLPILVGAGVAAAAVGGGLWWLTRRGRVSFTA